MDRVSTRIGMVREPSPEDPDPELRLLPRPMSTPLPLEDEPECRDDEVAFEGREGFMAGVK